jgi:hypothetical protein
MAFYTEFKNLTTGLDVVDISEFASAPVGTEFTRLNGISYKKNSFGFLDIIGTTDKLPIIGGGLTGPVTTNSTFDGRYVATDGAKLDTIESNANDYTLPATVIHESELSSSVSSTSITTAANSAAVKAAYDRAWPNTTYSVGDGELSEVSFTNADNIKLDGMVAGANNYALPATVIHESELSSSVSSTSTTVAANSAAVKTAYDRSWPNTTYSVGDGELSEINFTTADNTKLDGIDTSANNYSHPSNHAISVITGLQTALNLKAPLDSPTLTGAPTAPTPSVNTNTTQIATTAYVQTEITDLIGGAPNTLDTLNELAAAINDDSSYAGTLTTALSTKVAKTSNQALSTAANAMTISGHTITLNRGDGTTDAVTVPDNNTTYSVGDGGLTQVNFTTADNDKLDAIESGATADQTAGQIKAHLANAVGSNELLSVVTLLIIDSAGSTVKTIYSPGA